MAIDDIQLINCDFPPIETSCRPSQFRCTRGSCVEMDRVCDFNDDCGDESDEKNCDKSAVVLRSDFESGFGQWTLPDDGLSEKWVILGGRSWKHSPGQPGRDHTLGTLDGKYMAYTGKPGVVGRVISPVLTAKASEQCHLRFYYYITLFDVFGTNHLRVFARTEPHGETMVFNRLTNRGQVWTRADIAIASGGQSFKIIFEGLASQNSSFLAVDDISLWQCNLASNQSFPEFEPTPSPPSCSSSQYQCQDGTCLEDVTECNFKNECPDGSDERNCGTCDFETGLCGWHDESLGSFSWEQRGSYQQAEPSMDATHEKKGAGHFMLLKLHSAGVYSDPALLLSPELSHVGPRCQFSFSYYLNVNPKEDHLSVEAQKSFDAGTDISYSLQTVSDHVAEKGKWTRITVALGKYSGKFRVVIKHRFQPFNDTVAIAIDDTKFQNCETFSGMQNISQSQALDCNFQDGTFCHFRQSYIGSDFLWTVGKTMGPTYKSIGVAKVSLTETAALRDVSLLTSDWINGLDTDLCLEFWYITFGTTLRIRYESTRTEKVIFAHHDFDYLWRLGRATIPGYTFPFMINIEAVLGSKSEVLYLSDVKAVKGRCPGTAMCTFQDGDCGYTKDPMFAWMRRSNIAPGYQGPKIDHSTGENHGYFMLITELSGAGYKNARLIGPSINQSPQQESCTYFWYNVQGTHLGTLAVKYRKADRLGNTDTELWSAKGEYKDYWLQGRVNIPKNTRQYKLMFEVSLKGGKWSKGSIALDDIESVKGPCPHPGSCDFDSDMCGYTSHSFINNSSKVESDVHWIRLRNGRRMSDYGPDKDHTGTKTHGGYAFSLQFLPKFVNIDWHKSTRMISPFLPSTWKSCLSFWYYFKGLAQGELKVLVKDTALFETNATVDDWTNKVVDLRSKTPYQIVFESWRNSHDAASMAIDDIVVSDGPCKAKTVPETHLPTTEPTTKRTAKPFAPKPTHPTTKRPAKPFAPKPTHPTTKAIVAKPAKPETNRTTTATTKTPVTTQSDEEQQRKSYLAFNHTSWFIAVVAVVSVILGAGLAFLVFVVLVRTHTIKSYRILRLKIPFLVKSPRKKKQAGPVDDDYGDGGGGTNFSNPAFEDNVRYLDY